MDILAILAIFLVSLSFHTSNNRPINSFALSFCAIIAVCLWMLVCILYLKYLMDKLRNKPNQNNANKVIKLLKGLSPFSKLLIRSNLLRLGITFDYFRDTFNRIVCESQNIPLKTKHQLRKQLCDLRVYKLNELPKCENTESSELTKPGSNEAKRFGDEGEENVWYNLKSLPGLNGYDVFFDVNIAVDYSNPESGAAQIDAVVVSEKIGVLLLEVKSYGGELDDNNVKTVKAKHLPPDLGTQIDRHHGTFCRVFADQGLQPRQVTDMLVLSYPHKAERRTVDYTTFSQNAFAVVSVDHLLPRITNMVGMQISQEQRQAISTHLSAHCREFVLSTIHSDATPRAETEAASVAAEHTHRFCTSCGNPLGDGAFCLRCGKKRN